MAMPSPEKGLKSIQKLGLFTFGITIARFALRLIKSVVFTRALGPANRGVFGLIVTLPSLVVSLGNLGFGLGNTYLVANKHRELKRIYGNVLLYAVLLGPLLMAMGYLTFSKGWLIKGNGEVAHAFLPWMLAAIPLILLSNFETDLIVAIRDIRFVNILNLSLSAAPLLMFPLLWVVTRKPLYSAVIAWFFGGVIVCIGATFRLLQKSGYSLGFSRAWFKDALFYGWRGFVNILANQLILRIDFLFVSALLGAKALGFYAVSVSLVEILLSLPAAFNLPFLPIRLGQDSEGSRNLTPIVIRHSLFVMFSVCILTAITGKIIIWILFGKRFLPAYTPLLCLLPGILFLSVYDFLRSDLYSHNLPGYVSWVAVAALLANLGLNTVLIPWLGINGAAISSSISYGLSTVLLMVKHKHLSGNSYRDLILITSEELSRLWGFLRFRR